MKLIENNLPKQWEEGNGNILFTHDGYMYDIGCLDDMFWLVRQKEDEYYDGLDNWEEVGSWKKEGVPVFKFLRGQ